MILKPYQAEALDWLEVFFKRCKAGGSPKHAYEETTREWRGVPLRYRSLPTLMEVPYICLRIPTGGGKTLIGGLAIERANRGLLFTAQSVTLWLVPSEPIREQTITALRDPAHLLHQAVFSVLGAVTVLAIEEALRVKPNVLHGSNTIIVATMQAFKQAEMDRLNVYKQNSEMMPHFEGISNPAVRGNQSLVDVLRMNHPLIIVDEAHNQGTDLAFETLARFEPSAILELTATPDRSRHPSNVLFSVGASALQAAEMIKLPLQLVRRANWRDALRDAIARLNRLQAEADKECDATDEYLRPVMLLQAERRDADHETLTPEKVKKALIDDFGVPEVEIAIATGAVDDLGATNILDEQSRLRFIITVDKLREGWDCPFAYVLCSFRNTSSATAAEQVLGRILRMPHARRKSRPELNEAYAFITSADFQATIRCLKDALVANGFERQATDELIRAAEEPPEAGDDLFSYNTAITFTAPELPEPAAIPPALANKVELAPESGAITLTGRFTETQVAELAAIFQTEAGKGAIREAAARLKAPPPAPKSKTPAERGETLRVPLLAIRQGELWEAFEETHLLHGEWRLLDYSGELTEQEFTPLERAAQGGRFLLREEELKFEYFDKIETQLAFKEYQTEWDQVQLVAWLERNIPDPNIDPAEKAAFLNRAVTHLLEQKQNSLADLTYAKSRLRSALEAKLVAAKRAAMGKIHQTLLLQPDRFAATDRVAMVFQPGKYVYDWPYNGFTDLPKHFFPQIGNLRAEGEEFECAVFLATQLAGVKCWVRNVERKPTSFPLQTATDKFYPDFICQLEDGRILVVEYKNSRDWDLPDNREKRQLGELWERRSNGRGLFIMPRGKDWAAISGKVGQ